MKTIALLTFIAVYALLLLLPKYRAVSALSAAALFLFLRIVPLGDVAGTVDWNVLMMLAGTMGTVDLFIRSNMPNRLSDRLVAVLPSVKWLIIALALFAGLVSAFVDNVATVLMLAPVGLAISKKLNISPVQPILAIAVSSNLQGAATLVGDTTSILLGGHMGLDFMDFFAYRGRPGLFWVVQAGALMTVPVMLFLFRKEKGKLYGAALTPVTDYLPTCLLLGTVLSLIAASFIPNKPEITNGLICMTFFLAGLAAECGRYGTALAKDVLKAIDYETLALLAGLFLVIRGIERAGIIDDLSHIITGMGGGNLFLTYTIIVWASVLISAFVDNIPYTATMLPVVGGVATALGVDQTVLCFGLLVGATLGGNLTPVGASANIAACGILRREGYEVSAGQFMRIGVPFTLMAVLTGYVLCWLGVRPDHGPDLLGDAALTADHLPHIIRGDAQLQRQFLIALNLRHGDAVRIVHQVSGDVEQQVLHAPPSGLEDVHFFQQSSHGVSGLSAGLDPLLGAVSVDLDIGGSHAGIVSADLLDETAIAGETGVSDNNTIERSLLGAHAAQSDLNH